MCTNYKDTLGLYALEHAWWWRSKNSISTILHQLSWSRNEMCGEAWAPSPTAPEDYHTITANLTHNIWEFGLNLEDLSYRQRRKPVESMWMRWVIYFSVMAFPSNPCTSRIYFCWVGLHEICHHNSIHKLCKSQTSAISSLLIYYSVTASCCCCQTHDL